MKPKIGDKLLLEVTVKEIYTIGGETEVWFQYAGPFGYPALASAPINEFLNINEKKELTYAEEEHD